MTMAEAAVSTPLPNYTPQPRHFPEPAPSIAPSRRNKPQQRRACRVRGGAPGLKLWRKASEGKLGLRW